MRKLFCMILPVAGLFLLMAGCSEQSDIKKDAMDARSLTALEHPPPGVPGAPSQSGTPPGKTAGTPAAPPPASAGSGK